MDATRALQFVRCTAQGWNIDKKCIGGAGSSAGGRTILWLAYHDDLADPESEDPVEQESSRLSCVAVSRTRTTPDPKQMKARVPNGFCGNRVFAKKDFDEFLADREQILPWITEYSPYSLLSSDDCPTCLIYLKPPAIGEPGRIPPTPPTSA